MIGGRSVAQDDVELRTRAGTELAAVVAKCMAVRPEDRYASMARGQRGTSRPSPIIAGHPLVPIGRGIGLASLCGVTRSG
jgi:hypothetical protein